MQWKMFRVTDQFTRPADTTAYTSADLVANNVTAGSVVPLKFNFGRGGFYIVSLKLAKNNTTVMNATFKVHLFGTSPTVANGDNGAISYNISDRIAVVTMPTMTAGTDKGQAFVNIGDTGFPNNIAHYDADGTIYALLEAGAAYTPASGETFDLTITAELCR